MGFRVNKKTLLLIAGCIWVVAGLNILRIGLVTWMSDAHDWLFRLGEAIVIFLLFFNFVFRRLYYKHSERIAKKGEKNCPFSFFDAKGWLIMIFMISFGVAARYFHWFPNSFISVFYTGLSSALIITGFLFLRQGVRMSSDRSSKN